MCCKSGLDGSLGHSCGTLMEEMNGYSDINSSLPFRPLQIDHLLVPNEIVHKLDERAHLLRVRPSGAQPRP